MTSVKQPLIILTGPTAVGKTALSIELAKAVGGEIISADSMQVYRHMDIGSAKVTKEEMEGIPHYLIDVLDPQDDFNVVTFQTMAKQAMNEIYSHNKIPIITGGTGFYIQALLYDIDFKENDEKNPVREELEQLAEKLGENAPQVLHHKLQEVDPEAAAQIHANNIKRVIRAIEYFKQTGEKNSQHNEEMHQKDYPYNFLYYVLTRDRKVLYARIDRRVDIMMENGLVDEVKKLKDMGCQDVYKRQPYIIEGTVDVYSEEILAKHALHFYENQYHKSLILKEVPKKKDVYKRQDHLCTGRGSAWRKTSKTGHSLSSGIKADL